MKKLNAIFAGMFALSLVISFFGCKTVPSDVEKVNPLDLLDDQSTFYLRVPTSVDPNFVQRVIQSNVQGLSDSDAKKVVSRIDTVYMGLIRHKKSTDFQIAALCDFPQIAIKKVFSKKNGWNTDLLQLTDSEENPIKYSVYERSGLLASFPATDIACVGRAVPSMTEQYHHFAYKIDSDSYSLESSVKDWLSYDDDIASKHQIRFYALKPQAFLTTLVGFNLNYKLSYVKGSLENDPKNENQFFMDIEFEFRDSRFVSPAKAMLSLAFGLTDSDVYKKSETNLVVSRVKINKQQLYKLLVL